MSPTRLGAMARFFSLLVFLLFVGSGHVSAKTTLSLFVDAGTPAENRVWQTVVEGFEKANPGIEVMLAQPQKTDFYYTQLISRFAGGTAPDVFFVRPATDGAFVQRGFVYDIDPLVKRDAAELNLGDFWEPQHRELKMNGKWWSLPYDYSTLVLLYHVQAFEESGLKPPAASWTWDDVMDAGMKLMRRGPDGKTSFWGFGHLGWYLSQFSEGFIQSFGGELFSADLTQAKLNAPGTIQALSVIPEMAAKRLFPLPGEGEYWSAFERGTAGMTLAGSWAIRSLMAESSIPDFGVAMLPNGLPGRRVVTATGGAFAMSSRTRHPDEAWKLMKWLASPYTQRLLLDVTTSIPPRKSLLPDWASRLRGKGPRQVGLIGEQLAKHGRNASPVGFNISTITWKYFELLASGQLSTEEAAARIEKELNVELKRQRPGK